MEIEAIETEEDYLQSLVNAQEYVFAVLSAENKDQDAINNADIVLASLIERQKQFKKKSKVNSLKEITNEELLNIKKSISNAAIDFEDIAPKEKIVVTGIKCGNIDKTIISLFEKEYEYTFYILVSDNNKKYIEFSSSVALAILSNDKATLSTIGDRDKLRISGNLTITKNIAVIFLKADTIEKL